MQKQASFLAFVKQWAYKFVGFLILFYILVTIDFGALKTALQNANIGYVFAALCLTPLHFFMKSSRWRALVQIFHLSQKSYEAWRIYMLGTYIGLVTPGRVGEFSKVYFLKKASVSEYHSYGKLSVSVVADRLFDIASIISVAGIASVVFFPQFLYQILGVVFFILVAGICLTMCGNAAMRRVFHRMASMLFPAKNRRNLSMEIGDFFSGFRELRGNNILKPLFFNLVAYTIFYFQIYYLALAFHAPLPFLYLFGAFSVAMIAALLPISFAGFGTREAALVFFFTQAGQSSELAIGFSLVYVAVILIPAAAIGFFYYLKNHF